MNPHEITVHALGWIDDEPVKEGEIPNVTLGVRVFVGDVEIKQVLRARTFHRVDGFATVTLALAGPVRVVNHDAASWASLAGE